MKPVDRTDHHDCLPPTLDRWGLWKLVLDTRSREVRGAVFLGLKNPVAVMCGTVDRVVRRTKETL